MIQLSLALYEQSFLIGCAASITQDLAGYRVEVPDSWVQDMRKWFQDQAVRRVTERGEVDEEDENEDTVSILFPAMEPILPDLWIGGIDKVLKDSRKVFAGFVKCTDMKIQPIGSKINGDPKDTFLLDNPSFADVKSIWDSADRGDSKRKWIDIGVEDSFSGILDLFERLGRAIRFIDSILLHGDRVAVFCAAGRDRSYTVVLAYLVFRLNFTAQEAFEIMNKIREPGANGKRAVPYLDRIFAIVRKMQNQSRE